MKRRQLLKHLKQYGCYLLREGTRHSVYADATGKNVTTVPRHGEIDNKLAAKICKDLGIPSP